MIKTLSNKVFLVCLLLASANQILEKGFGVYIPIVHSYLDDVLCFPIVLTLGLAAYRLVDEQYTLTKFHYVFTFVVYAVYFEWYLPQISSNATSDGWDLLAYTVGMTLFGYFINTEDEVSLSFK